jgi:hypothetical protein
MPERESGPPAHPDLPEDLTSWKEVASYLGVSVRRAQQWETELGLPVERFSTEQRARIRARRSEVDRWLHERTRPGAARRPGGEGGLVQERPSSPPAPTPAAAGPAGARLGTRGLPWAAVLAAAALSLAAAASLVWPLIRPASGAPASARIVDGELHALDEHGRPVWRKSFPEGRAHPPYFEAPLQKAGLAWRTNTPLVRDIDGDGQPEVLFVLNTNREDDAATGHRLICFGPDGTERWRYTPGRKTRWQDRQFDAAYTIWWVLAPLSIDDEPRLLVSASNTFFPCQLSLLDATDGRLVGEYWHLGALLSGVVLDADEDGRPEVLAAGVNNPGPGTGSPAIVELKLPLPPPRPEVATVFDSPRPRESAYALFPPVDAFGQYPHPAAILWLRLDEWDRLHLGVSLGPYHQTKGTALYVLDRRLTVTDVRADDLLMSYHEDLRRSGQLDHSLDEDEIRLWRNLRRFDAMPNANAPEVVSTWPRRDASTEESSRAVRARRASR